MHDWNEVETWDMPARILNKASLFAHFMREFETQIWDLRNSFEVLSAFEGENNFEAADSGFRDMKHWKTNW